MMPNMRKIKASIRLVLVKNSKKLSRKGSKMELKWHGPYRIHNVLGKGTFKLCNVDDSKKVQLWHDMGEMV